MHEYIRVLWKRRLQGEPAELYYEVCSDRSVPRMVEVYADGHAEADTLQWHAQRYLTFCGISLVDGEMPTAEQIRARVNRESPDQFEIFVITQEEFNTAFARARRIAV